jgi:hypothetical protein
MLSHIFVFRKYVIENNFRDYRKVVFTLSWKFSSIVRLLFLSLRLFTFILKMINLFMIQTGPVAVEFLLWFWFWIYFWALGKRLVV